MNDQQMHSLPAGARLVGTLVCSRAHPPLSRAGILRSLHSPILAPETAVKGATVFSSIKRGGSVVIAISDHTRKTAIDRVLPAIADGLAARGCRPDDMRILVASGIHRRPTDNDLRFILGNDMYSRFHGRILLHDPDDDSSLVEVGRTRRGHAVRVNRAAVAADNLILTGGVLYHYHAGFGGGRKALVPGLASRDTIAHNHSLTLDPDADRIHPSAAPGILDGNPVAEEMLESARMVRTAFIVNTVLTPDGGLAGMFAGDMDLAHRAACRMAAEIYRSDIPGRADLVIAEAPGASTWIQAHKALFNAHRAVKPGGVIVLYAPCAEGLGNDAFRHWVTRPDIGQIYAGLRKSPEILGQTALSTRMYGANAILVTEMTDTDTADIRMRKAPDIETAIRTATADLSGRGVSEPSCILMPEAMYTLPFPPDLL